MGCASRLESVRPRGMQRRKSQHGQWSANVGWRANANAFLGMGTLLPTALAPSSMPLWVALHRGGQ
jgi:hypothetical protein